METLKAKVTNGRLVLDEPTDLPEGQVVELVYADGDDRDDADRAALHESLRESVREMNDGQLIDVDEAIAQLRAHR